MISELERTFAEKTLDEWNEILFTLEGMWATLQSPAEVIADRQARENGFVTTVGADDDA